MKSLQIIAIAWLSFCLSGCQSINRTAGSPYHFAEIDYFIELTTKLQYQKGVRREVTKWEKPILLYVAGSPRDEDIFEIRNIADEINDIVATKLITVLENNDSNQANMIIHCVPFRSFPSIIPNRVVHNRYHFSVSQNPDKSYNQATILVGDEIMSQQNRNSAFRATITRSLGLVNTSKRFQHSIFNPNLSASVTQYNDMDREMIKLLYRDEIVAGMDYREIRVAIENIVH